MARREKTHTAEAVVLAAPAAAYDLVADVTRMGEWSPECYQCVWLQGARGPAEGARFRGSNRFGRLRWSRTCEVVAARRGEEFSFRTVPDRWFRSSTRWTFRFTDAPGGTRVTQSYLVERRSRPIDVFDRVTKHTEAVERGMQRTLTRIKLVAES